MSVKVNPCWDTLQIRKEISGSSGAVDDVQMSLFRAVYADRDRPPYADPEYYGEISCIPHPNLSN